MLNHCANFSASLYPYCTRYVTRRSAPCAVYSRPQMSSHSDHLNIFVMTGLSEVESAVVKDVMNGRNEFHIDRHWDEKDFEQPLISSKDSTEYEFMLKLSNRLYNMTNIIYPRIGPFKGDFNYDLVLDVKMTFSLDEPLGEKEEWLSNFNCDFYLSSMCNNMVYSGSRIGRRLEFTLFKPIQINQAHQLPESVYDKLLGRYIGPYRATYLYYAFNDQLNGLDELEFKKKLVDLCYMNYPMLNGLYLCSDFDRPSRNPDLYENLLTFDETKSMFERYPSWTIAAVMNTDDSSGEGQHHMALVITKDKIYLMCSQCSNPAEFSNRFFQEWPCAWNKREIQTDKSNCGVYSLLCILNFMQSFSIEEAVAAVGVGGKEFAKYGRADDKGVYGVKRLLFHVR